MDKIIPLFDEDTPLKNIPRWWLKYVEPKVLRGAFRPCWIWTGAVDVAGYPRRYVRRPDASTEARNLRREIVSLFWKLPDSYTVSAACHVATCVNPSHLIVKERK